MAEEIVAQVELNVGGNAYDDPARQEQENVADSGYGQQQQRKVLELVKRNSGVEIINSPANDLGKNPPRAVVQKNANCPRRIAPTVALEIEQHRTQALRQDAGL